MKLSHIEIIEQQEEYWDLEVENTHCYFANNILVHNSNASVCLDTSTGDMWAQSRENIITPLKDNFGFAFFVESKKEAFTKLFNDIIKQYNITNEIITIYGEWAGPGIQKGVGISEIPNKTFFIFGVKITPQDEDKAYWVDHGFDKEVAHGNILVLSDSLNDIWNTEQSKMYFIDIDFNSPQMAVNQMLAWVEEVENECPVAKDWGISGIGEGIVWTAKVDDTIMRFKTKGEKHSRSKVKTLKPVDNELEAKKQLLAGLVTPGWRIDQAIQEVCNIAGGGIPTNKDIGGILKWMNQDIIKEETLTIADSGLEFKDIVQYVNTITKRYFFDVVNTY